MSASPPRADYYQSWHRRLAECQKQTPAQLCREGTAIRGSSCGGTSAAPRRLDRGDVDLLHAHHRIKRALCFIAAGRQRLGQHARRDLPGDAPLVFAPAALALLAAIADDGVPVAVGLLLIVGGDLEREGFVMLERGTAVEADTGTPATVNSTVSTSPSLPDG